MLRNIGLATLFKDLDEFSYNIFTMITSLELMRCVEFSPLAPPSYAEHDPESLQTRIKHK
jgi:hypothetical protein